MRHSLPEDAISLDGERLQVRTDPIALEVVLTNLLENAVKYSRDMIKVDVRIYQPVEGQVAIAIADTGVGIPPHQFKRIFHRFHRVGNELTRSRKGTGLGLYIVKETLRHMKGTVRVVSQGENMGSVFTVTLPGGPRV
jgi:signal transduction histidine kinase